MIVLHGKNNSKKKEYKRHNNSNKENIIAVVKVAANKSILMQITKGKAVNLFH
jgi:hypothetical protein